jgi:SAM-dependent methyltransferase
MELSGLRQKHILPVSRGDLVVELDKWKSGNSPITRSSLIDGKVVIPDNYDFTKGLASQKSYTNDWTLSLRANLKGLDYYIKSCNLIGGMTLEIGCYEGAGTNVINEVFRPSVQICCDPWDSNYEDINFHFKNQYENFKHNTQDLDIVEMRKPSDEMFAEISPGFDFIYIDGDHHYEQVARDLNNALNVLRIGGLCLIDDYQWGEATHNPVRRAVNEFYNNNLKRIVRINLDNDVQFAFTRTV